MRTNTKIVIVLLRNFIREPLYMTFQEFVFGEEKSRRIKRHFFFWTAWCFYFAGTFLIPTYWIPAWNFKGPLPQIENYGVLISCIRIIINSILMTIVHMVLVYGIMYYFIPRYQKKKKQLFLTTVLLFIFIAAVAAFNYLNFLFTFSISTSMGFFPKMPGWDFIVPIWIRQIVFNYPTVIGFAITVKLLKNWYVKQKENQLLAVAKVNAELQLLKSQVHPHFLFNTLNNIYAFILDGSDMAPEMVRKLSSLLNYILNDCNQAKVSLQNELAMIEDYISLEQVRYGERLNLTMEIQGNASEKMIYPLLLIPFVENSFKHGTSKMLAHPWIRLEIIIGEKILSFKLSNNKPDNIKQLNTRRGIGLKNVTKRLQLLYPETHSLKIMETEMSFSVCLNLNLSMEDSTEGKSKIKNMSRNYDFA